jgi:hypothetical protein
MQGIKSLLHPFFIFTPSANAKLSHISAMEAVLKKLTGKISREIMKMVMRMKNLDDRGVERLIWIVIFAFGLLLYYFFQKGRSVSPSPPTHCEKDRHQRNQ